MEEKLCLKSSLRDAFVIGVKNMASIVAAVFLWHITCWIPYINVGTTIAMTTIPVKLSHGDVISPTFIFNAKYRHCMGEYFLLVSVIAITLFFATLALIVPAIVLSYSWMLAVYLLVGKNMNWAKCISESNRLMMGYKFKVFIFKIVVALALLAVGGTLFYICNCISENIAAIFGILFMLIAVSVGISVDAVIYRELVTKADEPAHSAAAEL